MPPRHQTLPPPQTSSAREAQKSFYCALCSKGYSRMNEYEAHLSSYDHTHKQRLKDMKAMVRDPNAGARARKAEAKADGLVSIKFEDKDKGSQSASAAGAGKKPGFKRSGFKSAFASKEAQPAAAAETPVKVEATATSSVKQTDSPEESTTEDEGYERYDPRYPTD
ncbi:hypothetical protein CDD83_2541 [Cordyceps sp. RAO-2017]|nr:hypothetical protein CDD83_2541 [Cordyceps sp. RAO-2017]